MLIFFLSSFLTSLEVFVMFTQLLFRIPYHLLFISNLHYLSFACHFEQDFTYLSSLAPWVYFLLLSIFIKYSFAEWKNYPIIWFLYNSSVNCIISIFINGLCSSFVIRFGPAILCHLKICDISKISTFIATFTSFPSVIFPVYCHSEIFLLFTLY